MPLLITIVAIDNEETHAKEGFSLKIVSWGQDRGDKNNLPPPPPINFVSWTGHWWSFTHESAETEECFR